MITVLRPLSTSELLDRTFHLYRNHFLLFVGITAIPQLLVLMLRLVGAVMITGRTFALFGSVLGLVAGLISYAAIEISQAATVMAVSNIHLERPVSIGAAFSAAKQSMWRVIGISFAVAIAVGVALIFLIIPGIYVALMWSLAIPVTVLEGGGLAVSTTRSKELTKGSRGRIFVIYLLILVLTMIVAIIFQMPLGILVALIGRGNPATSVGLIQAVSAIGTFLSTSLVGGLAVIALTLIYYDQRVRKEGFDLQLMMTSLQSSPQAAAAAPAL
jgi:Membrane domain of glycerophosphoryl diester phosphodiesterase